ncbi:ankyrin repeat-containing domain protein [Mycena latifolia]|nr:ankyrin repeat-containing domain protein [Mycena latifolia]
MSERRRDRFSNWLHNHLHPRSRDSSRAPTPSPASPAPLSISTPSAPSANDQPATAANSISTADGAVDNLTVVLGLVQQVSNIVQKAPFIAPVAGLMTEILTAYKEVKATDDKRDALLANIVDLSRDLCSTILRMDATNHIDLIGRLKADIEIYAGLLAKASQFIQNYDDQGVLKHIAARNELGTTFSALSQALDSFGARFRSNRLVDLAINQNANARTLNEVHDIVVEEKLEKWLKSPPDMKQKQFDTQKLRKEGTGLWLLEGNSFMHWQDTPGSLWIRGPSGAGKSVLSSAIISKLMADKQLYRDLETSPAPAIAFFYFDFKEKGRQTVESALCRICLQLSAQSPHLYRTLDKQYRASNGQTLPTYQDLLKNLKKLLKELGHTYIVLDALDECQEADLEQLLDFVSVLRDWTRTPLHLLITSQPRSVFTEHFQDFPCIELQYDVTQEDIKLFVSSELHAKRSLNPWISRAEYVTEQIVLKSSGMFRMAACLLVELSRRWTNAAQLDKILDSLPTDLFGIYDRFIEAVHPDDLVYATGVLRWIIFSTEKMTLNKLADAVAFDFSDTTRYVYKPAQREGNTILRWLEGLVMLRKESSGELQVILAHASVQDYVLSMQFSHKFGSNFSASFSHTFMAQTCICYLLHFSDHPLDITTVRNYPLALYAAQNWCLHLLVCHNRDIVFANAMYLLEDESKQYQALKHLQRCLRAALPESPLHLCCRYGYIEGVCSLLANGANPNQESKQGGTPFQIAVAWGHADIVHALLKNNPYESMIHPTYALEIASNQGDTEMVQVLLKNGFDLSIEGRDALQVASEGGHTAVVQLLLENGANVNEMGGEYGSALQAASWAGYTGVVQLLLKNGAAVNAMSGEYSSALQVASQGGYTEVVQLLLEKGADVNSTGGSYGESPLEAASQFGYTEMAQLLLENGADVNAGNALQVACNGSNIEVVHLLLKNGANVNAGGGKYGSALRTASQAGCTEIVQLLLEKGADANSRGGPYFDSPLEAASQGGYTEVVQLLLENGADVIFSMGGEYGSALQAAAQGGFTEVARLLLENGAEVNTWGGKYGSALQAAAGASLYFLSNSRSDSWLEDRVNVNAPGGEVVRLLLENGADVNAMGGKYGSALQAASFEGYMEVVCLLLKNGADVNAGGGEYGSALQAASYGGCTEVVQLLLKNGANMHATVGKYGSALQAAHSKGHKKIVDLLLANGAVDTRVGDTSLSDEEGLLAWEQTVLRSTSWQIQEKLKAWAGRARAWA